MERHTRLWTALALGLTATLVGLDLALPSTTMIAAMVAPPLLAAARAGWRATALVGAVSVVAAIGLGVPNQVFGETSHVVRCGVVAIAGLLAVWVAALGQRLTQSRDQLRAILEGVADGVVARNADGRVVFANRAALDLMGFERAEAFVQTSGETVEDRLEMRDEQGRTVGVVDLPGQRARGGESPESMVVHVRSVITGAEHWLLIKSTPIHDNPGRPAMSITILEDVTESKRQERSQRLLAEAGQLLSSSMDYEATLRSLAEIAVPDFADWCAVEVVEPGGGVRRVGLAASDPSKLPLARHLRERYPPHTTASHGVHRVLRTGESMLIKEVDSELLARVASDREHLRLLTDLGMASVIVAPLTRRGGAVGAVSFLNGRSSRRFDEGDLAVAQELAARMATALENARLYSERSHIARALQESLLPPALPEVAGLDVAARFRAAGEAVEVGGDFYDLFDIGDGCWGVMMGDVCGKGPGAAAVTALARYTLRAAAMRESRPSAVLATLNEAMLRQRHDDQFCTVAFGSFVAVGDNLRLTLSSGGHPLPLLLRADGRVHGVGRTGTLLGVVDDPELSDDSVELAPGDAVIFYTDGVTEAHAPERIVTTSELSARLRECRDCDAATLAERLERHAVPLDREPRDDVAILVLKLRAGP